jgi:hypothetical protein
MNRLLVLICLFPWVGALLNSPKNDLIKFQSEFSESIQLQTGFTTPIVSLSTVNVSSVGMVITTSQNGDDFGRFVDLADCNNDGKADLIIGAPRAVSEKGIVAAIYGSTSLAGSLKIENLQSPSKGFAVTGGSTSSRAGFGVAAGKDVNNDGKPDLAIGAPLYNSRQGRLFIVFGSIVLSDATLQSPMTTDPGVVITGANTGDDFGISFSIHGDLSSDGVNDILIGAPSYNSGRGRVYLLSGSSGLSDISNIGSLSTAAVQTIDGQSSGDSFGNLVLITPDINGDGKPDMLIQSYHGSSDRGIVYLIYGTGNPASLSSSTPPYSGKGITITGESTGDNCCVFSASDIDGDGFADMLLGAEDHNSNSGKVYLLWGSAGLPNISFSGFPGSPTVGLVIFPAGSSYAFGASVSIGGDLNGDDKPDLLIGSPGWNSNTGGAFLIQGVTRTTMSPVIADGLSSTSTTLVPSGIFYRGIVQGDNTGTSVKIGGDANNDGIDDLIIGMESLNSGEVYLVYGAAPEPTSQPTREPTSHPTGQPSGRPNGQPTTQPWARPTGQPTAQPNVIPTSSPSSQPTTQPMSHPTGHPSSQPSVQPTGRPISMPSSQPSVQPWSCPSSRPTAQPSFRPSGQPTAQPTVHVATAASASTATTVIIGGVVGGAVGLSLIGFVLFWFCRRGGGGMAGEGKSSKVVPFNPKAVIVTAAGGIRNSIAQLQQQQPIDPTKLREFTWRDIDFGDNIQSPDDALIGRGAFGIVIRAQLKKVAGLTVAIKVITKQTAWTEKKDYNVSE